MGMLMLISRFGRALSKKRGVPYFTAYVHGLHGLSIDIPDIEIKKVKLCRYGIVPKHSYIRLAGKDHIFAVYNHWSLLYYYVDNENSVAEPNCIGWISISTMKCSSIGDAMRRYSIMNDQLLPKG